VEEARRGQGPVRRRLAADTVVVFGDEVLEKPRDRADATNAAQRDLRRRSTA